MLTMGGVLEAADTSRDRDKRANHLWMLHREVDRRRATHRHADHVRALDIQAAQQIAQLLGAGHWLLSGRRLAKPLDVETNHAVVLRELLDLLIPHARISDTRVNQQQCLAGAD